MHDLNLHCRTIDAILTGYAKQNLPCFLADLDLTMDVVK
jgi:alcohol-forming fatty acyl-CoA reductase